MPISQRFSFGIAGEKSRKQPIELTQVNLQNGHQTSVYTLFLQITELLVSCKLTCSSGEESSLGSESIRMSISFAVRAIN